MKSRELNFLADLIEAHRLSWPPDASQLRSTGITGDEAAYWRLLGSNSSLLGWVFANGVQAT